MGHHDKDNGRNPIRTPISDSGKTDDNTKTRRTIGTQLRQDTKLYEDKYPDKALAKITDENGELDRWFEAGAELVPRITPGGRVYEGINDSGSNKWARWVAGTGANGATIYTYLVMMNKEDYDWFKNAPDRKRQADIEAAMRGGVTEESASFAGGGQIKSYAASLPDGSGVGYNRIKSN